MGFLFSQSDGRWLWYNLLHIPCIIKSNVPLNAGYSEIFSPTYYFIASGLKIKIRPIYGVGMAK